MLGTRCDRDVTRLTETRTPDARDAPLQGDAPSEGGAMTIHGQYGGDGQDETGDLVRSMALSSAKLWGELFERLDRLEQAQSELCELLSQLHVALPAQLDGTAIERGEQRADRALAPGALTASFADVVTSMRPGAEAAMSDDEHATPVGTETRYEVTDGPPGDGGHGAPLLGPQDAGDLPLTVEWHLGEPEPAEGALPPIWVSSQTGPDPAHDGPDAAHDDTPRPERFIGEPPPLSAPPPSAPPPPPPPPAGFRADVPPPPTGFRLGAPPAPAAPPGPAAPPPPAAPFPPTTPSSGPPPPARLVTPPPPPPGFRIVQPAAPRSPAPSGPHLSTNGQSNGQSNGRPDGSTPDEETETRPFDDPRSEEEPPRPPAITPDFFARAGRRRH